MGDYDFEQMLPDLSKQFHDEQHPQTEAYQDGRWYGQFYAGLRAEGVPPMEAIELTTSYMYCIEDSDANESR